MPIPLKWAVGQTVSGSDWNTNRLWKGPDYIIFKDGSLYYRWAQRSDLDDASGSNINALIATAIAGLGAGLIYIKDFNIGGYTGSYDTEVTVIFENSGSIAIHGNPYISGSTLMSGSLSVVGNITGSSIIASRGLTKSASYVIYSSSGYYWGENGLTGNVDYGGSENVGGATGTNLSSVFQKVLDHISGSGGGKVFLNLEGTHSLTVPINLKVPANGLVVEGLGYDTIFDNDTTTGLGCLFHDTGNTALRSGLVLRNFAITGYGSVNACIYLADLVNCHLEQLYLRSAGKGIGGDVNAHGLHLKNFMSSNIVNCELSYNDGWGAYLENATLPSNAVSFFGGRYNENTLGGIYNLQGVGNAFHSVVVEANTGVGLQLTGTRANNVFGGYFENNATADIQVNQDGTSYGEATNIYSPYTTLSPKGVILGAGVKYSRIIGDFFTNGIQLDATAQLNKVETKNTVTDNNTDLVTYINWIWNLYDPTAANRGWKNGPFRLSCYDATASITTRDSAGIELDGKRWTGAASSDESSKIYKKMLSTTENDDCISIENDVGQEILRLYNAAHATKPAYIDCLSHVIKDPNNEVDATLSGTAKLIKIDIGGTPYYFKVYPTKT